MSSSYLYYHHKHCLPTQASRHSSHYKDNISSLTMQKRDSFLACVSFASCAILVTSCSTSPKDILGTYLDSPVASPERYETICEKRYVSPDEFRAYYSSGANDDKASWKTVSMRESGKIDNMTTIAVDHTADGKKFTSEYKVFSRRDGDPCVSWTYYGRSLLPATRLIRYPNDKITIFALVELSDYYNYDFRGRESTHMSLRIKSSGDSTWEYKNVYIPYDGNENLYDYVSTNKNPLVKMIASREYTVNLDSDVVDSYNKSLYNLKATIDSLSEPGDAAREFQPKFLPYELSYITDDEDILYAPTAVPIKID